MSKSMSKVFAYKNYKFNVKVELDFRVEKKINGNRFHRVTMSDMGSSNWFQEKEVLTKELSETISHFQIQAEMFVDDRDKRSEEEKFLASIGFS